MSTVFLRILDADDKASALLEAVREAEHARGRARFEVDPRSFAKVPRSPFAYWVSDRLRDLFKELPPFEAEGRAAKQGLATADDFRFVRAWWEVAEERVGTRWFPFAKGGKFSPFYADVYLVVNWESHGAEIVNFCKPGSDRVASRPQNVDFFFRPGLTWPLRTSGFSMRAMPAGCLFGHKGPAAFVDADDHDSLTALACMTNSLAFGELVSLQLARTQLAQSYEVGLIQNTPVPSLTSSARASLSSLASHAWSLRRSLDTSTETSHAFAMPAILQIDGASPSARAAAWIDHISAIHAELAAVQADVDRSCFEIYGIEAEDRSATTEGSIEVLIEAQASADALPVRGDDPGADVLEPTADPSGLVAEFISWTVGVAFGRFDVRLATGERDIPPEPEPFDPLQACSPGMLTGDDGLPGHDAPDAYPLSRSRDGIMVDDAGHSEDLAKRVRDVFEVTFGAAADAWWQECAQLLGGDLRRWLARSFFETHLKSHSKSRRRAPIYWQLATPTGSYSVWLYAHRASPDTLFRVFTDFVTPKLRHEERKLTNLTQEAGSSPSASQRKDIDAQRNFVEELRSFRDEVARAAPLWRPELDDGILVTCAPLWRLVYQQRSWQREAKGCWTKLCKGEYDWAHLAMHLWPERVVPKCATDRSLAIAHELESFFWVEAEGGKWMPREVDRPTIDRLIGERASAAVAAAVADLTAAE